MLFTVHNNFPPSSMSPEHSEPTDILEADVPEEGADRADALLDAHLHQTGSIGEIRTEVHLVLVEVEGDQEAEARVHQYETKLAGVATGHDHVQLKEMEGGKQGQNQVGTHNSEANTELVFAKGLIDHTEVVDEVLDHEDEEATGHAGQIVGREALVSSEGDVVEGTELYEGEVEARQGVDKRGSAQAARDGQPAENYGSGQQKVAPDLEVYSDYLRNGKERVQAQAELMRGQNREEIMVTLGKSGKYSKEDTLQVISMAA